MSRDRRYQKLLNSREWKELRRWKLQHDPLCERCKAEGYVTSAIDVHHITPVESAMTLEGMRALCFNPDNLQSLCIPCHAKTHRELRSHSKEAHQQRATDQLNRWLDKHKGETSKNNNI